MTKEQFKEALKQRVPAFLRISAPEAGSAEDLELDMFIASSASYVEDAIGAIEDWSDERLAYIALVNISDMYDVRNTDDADDKSAVSMGPMTTRRMNAAQRLVENFILQIKTGG